MTRNRCVWKWPKSCVWTLSDTVMACGSASGGWVAARHARAKSKTKLNYHHCTRFAAPYHTLYPTPCETPSAPTSNCSQQRIMYYIVYDHGFPCVRTIDHAKHIHRLSATPWHQCTRCSVLPLHRCAVPWLRSKNATAHGTGRIFKGDVL